MKSHKQSLTLVGVIIIPAVLLVFGCGGGGDKLATTDAASGQANSTKVNNNVNYSDSVVTYAEKSKTNYQAAIERAGENKDAFKADKKEINKTSRKTVMEKAGEAMRKSEALNDNKQEFPRFPWPPPNPSAIANISLNLLKNSHSKTIYLRDIDQKLSEAMSDYSYLHKSYFSVPNGFALVTKLEHIKFDGTPRKSDRWGEARIQTLDSLNLGEYFNALFTKNPGYYRTIAFIVTSESFNKKVKPITIEKVKTSFQRGENTLSKTIASQEFTSEYNITALIYEFKKIGQKKLEAIEESKVTGQMHLEKSNIWNKLGT